MSTLLSPSLLISAFVLAETEVPSIAATGTLTISASVVSAVITWIAAKRHAEATRLPQPFEIEQTQQQANWKTNAHDHENIFFRLAALEKQQAATDAKLNTELAHINRTLDRLADGVQKLHEIISDNERSLS